MHNVNESVQGGGGLAASKLTGSLCLIFSLLIFAELPPDARAQPSAGPSPLAGAGYVNVVSLPGDARPALKAHGKRLQSPGQERTVLVGTYTAQSTTTPLMITYQLPSSIRIDFGGSSPRSLIFDGKSSSISPGNADESILESLLDDAAESFFLGFSRGTPAQWLGSRFRTDGATTPNYTGPLYDIYRRVAPTPSVAGNPYRQKLYVFDSRTKLFREVRYRFIRAGQTVSVVVSYPSWIQNGSESFPTAITRTENGQNVFSISFATANTQPGNQSDSTFAIIK
jgi:hypothetical protein